MMNLQDVSCPVERYSDGLHQAIEAKRNMLKSKRKQDTCYYYIQNFFNKFDKKAGMTGTAATEKEFRDIYGMDVVTIPTNRQSPEKTCRTAYIRHERN